MSRFRLVLFIGLALVLLPTDSPAEWPAAEPQMLLDLQAANARLVTADDPGLLLAAQTSRGLLRVRTQESNAVVEEEWTPRGGLVFQAVTDVDQGSGRALLDVYSTDELGTGFHRLYHAPVSDLSQADVFSLSPGISSGPFPFRSRLEGPHGLILDPNQGYVLYTPGAWSFSVPYLINLASDRQRDACSGQSRIWVFERMAPTYSHDGVRSYVAESPDWNMPLGGAEFSFATDAGLPGHAVRAGEHLLYCGAGRVSLISVADPDQPTLVQEIDSAWGARWVHHAVHQDVLYVTDGEGALWAVALSEWPELITLGSWPVSYTHLTLPTKRIV